METKKIYNKVEIAKLIREQLKKQFKFSVTTDNNSICISVVKGIKLTKSFDELTELAIFRYTQECNRTEEELKKTVEEGYHQLGRFRDDYDPDVWSNGAFLTEVGHKMFQRITQITDQWNWDNSDSQIDYFDVNFYLNLQIGKQWDIPYEVIK